MPTRFAAIFAVAFLVPAIDLLRGDTKGPELPSAILVPTAARLVEVTATVKFTNESATDIQKYLFRLTTPPNDLPYDRPVGFARASNTEITLKREGAWVWSTALPPDGIAPNRPKPTVKSVVSWHCKVVQEGNAARLLSEFANGADGSTTNAH